MLQGRSYVPMLHARLAEVRALSELSNGTKNKIFPVIKARPWLNSRSLGALWEKIDDAFPMRAFGLDLDETRRQVGTGKPAYDEFAELFDPQDGFAKYYDQVEEIDQAVPVFRPTPDLENASRQVERLQALDRGVILRFRPMQLVRYRETLEAINAAIHENVVVVLDCGWGRDILSQAAACVQLIETALETNENFEFVVGGSSFPDSFSKQGERIEIAMIERRLYQEVRRHLNRGQLTYGDWGSTRPPTDPIPMRNIPRIDFAIDGRWIAHRSDGDEEYVNLADHTLQDPDWRPGLGIWAEYMIQSTAAGLDPCIKSAVMAAAVRVNMHMHIQANLDNPEGLSVGDEPFDDI